MLFTVFSPYPAILFFLLFLFLARPFPRPRALLAPRRPSFCVLLLLFLRKLNAPDRPETSLSEERAESLGGDRLLRSW